MTFAVHNHLSGRTARVHASSIEDALAVARGAIPDALRGASYSAITYDERLGRVSIDTAYNGGTIILAEVRPIAC